MSRARTRRARCAYFYDWHNAHRLVDQNADIEYWQRELRSDVPGAVAVFGAGTGRIASQLDAPVVAVDYDRARLARMTARSSHSRVCADFRRPLVRAATVRAVLFPYSAIQLVDPAHRPAVFASVFESLAPGGCLYLDASDNFARLEPSDWRPVFAAPSRRFRAMVEELARVDVHDHYVEISLRWHVGGTEMARDRERWFFHEPGEYARQLEQAGFSAFRTSRGYGNGRSQHRTLYRCRKAP